MSIFRVTRESVATRCEICHQTDLFNAISGHCKRCGGLVNPQIEPSPVRPSTKMPLWQRLLRLEGGWGTFFLFCFLAFLFAPGFFPGGSDRQAHPSAIVDPRGFRHVATHRDRDPGPISGEVFEFPSLFSIPKPAVGVDEAEYAAKNIEFAFREARKMEHVHPAELSLKDAGPMKARSRRGILGMEFEAQADGKTVRCFIPGLSLLPGDAPKRIAELLLRKSRVTVSGQYDSETRVIFVERLVFKNAMTLQG